MRDVIVIGAGGGGPVVAKELAARGLDVLLLEAGPRHADPRGGVDALRERRQQPARPATSASARPTASKPAWLRETPQNSFIWQLSGVGGTTQHYYGNNPRADARASSSGTTAPTRRPTTPRTCSRSRYGELVPYYEWVERTLPVQTAAMGTKEETFFRRAPRRWACRCRRRKRRHRRRRSGRRRTRSSSRGGNAGQDRATRRSCVFPQATGCTFCGYCFQGCIRAARGAAQPQAAKRSTDNSYVPMALTADKWAPGGKAVTLVADAFVTRINTAQRAAQLVASGVTWRVGATGERAHRGGEGHRAWPAAAPRTRGCGSTAGCPNPNDWVGRGYTDHFFDWVIGVCPRLHRLVEGRRLVGARPTSRPRRPGERRPAAGAAGVRQHVQRRRHRAAPTTTAAARPGRGTARRAG